MVNKNILTIPSEEVVKEAVAQYETEDSAKAVAYVVKETDARERMLTLQAVVDEVNPDELSRLEKREVFLIQRRKQQHAAKERIVQIAIQLAFDSRR